MNSDMFEDISGYCYGNASLNLSHNYILPSLRKILESVKKDLKESRIFELGCGNGSIANELTKIGFDVTGVDPSEQGIVQANRSYPALKLYRGSACEDLAVRYGTFPVVISLEVIEHLYNPRKFAESVYLLVEEGGIAIISTPYHGYWKNLALALTGKMDDHFTALWDHGHIKFWSMKTMRAILEEAGFRNIVFRRVGRIPIIAKAMFAIAKKERI